MAGKAKSWKARVEKLIEKYGSIETVASELGVSYYTIHRWRNGTHVPSAMGKVLIESFEGGRKISGGRLVIKRKKATR